MAEYVKTELTEELKRATVDLLEKSKKGKIKAGVNEVTKAIERGTAKFVVVAEDVSPPEIVMHLPLLCSEKQVPISYIGTKQELGEKAGLGVSTTSIAILQSPAEKELKTLGEKIAELKK